MWDDVMGSAADEPAVWVLVSAEPDDVPLRFPPTASIDTILAAMGPKRPVRGYLAQLVLLNTTCPGIRKVLAQKRIGSSHDAQESP